MSTFSDGPCSRCREAHGRSCCEIVEGEPLATLTWADVDRVEAHTGRPAKVFCETEWLGLEEARAYELHRPAFAGYFQHGPARLTLKVARGACVLLHPATGCILPPEARPIACRLYPLEPWPDGTVSVLAGGQPPCLAVDEACSVPELMRGLGMSSDEVELLAGQLRRDVKDHARRTGRNHRVP